MYAYYEHHTSSVMEPERVVSSISVFFTSNVSVSTIWISSSPCTGFVRFRACDSAHARDFCHICLSDILMPCIMCIQDTFQHIAIITYPLLIYKCMVVENWALDFDQPSWVFRYVSEYHPPPADSDFALWLIFLIATSMDAKDPCSSSIFLSCAPKPEKKQTKHVEH